MMNRIATLALLFVAPGAVNLNQIATARRFAEDYPQLDICPVCADFTEPVPLPELAIPASPN